MASRLFIRVARVRVTLLYAMALAVVSTVLSRLSPDAQERVVQHASTNLHNLSRGHVGTLFGSAFVADAGPVYEWLPGLICLLGVGELLWCSGHLLVAFAVGHVGATLLVAVGLAAAVHFEWLPGSVSRVADVGMSYGAVAVLGALSPAVPRQWRLVWIGWWLGVGMTAVAGGMDFSNVGHLMALMLGMVVATRFGAPQPWTRARVALLVVGGAFGYLILVNGAGSATSAALVGMVGAVVGFITSRVS